MLFALSQISSTMQESCPCITALCHDYSVDLVGKGVHSLFSPPLLSLQENRAICLPPTQLRGSNEPSPNCSAACFLHNVSSRKRKLNFVVQRCKERCLVERSVVQNKNAEAIDLLCWSGLLFFERSQSLCGVALIKRRAFSHFGVAPLRQGSP